MNGVIKVAAAAAWCREPKKRCLFPSQCLAHCSCYSSCWLPAQEGRVPTSQELLPAPQCSATSFLNSHFFSPVSPSPSLLKEVVFYFSHRDVVGTFKTFESWLQFLRWHQWNSHWCNWLEIQGCWLDIFHESGFPPTSSGHRRVNWYSLGCCTWMKMPASSGMIIFISESFQSVLGWMRSHRHRGLLYTSLFFPGVALFPREGTHRSKPLRALGAASIAGRVLSSLSCLLRPGNGSWCWRARDMGPYARLLSCVASWEHALNYTAHFWLAFLLLFFVFFLICPPDLELKPSIHFTDNLILNSSQQQLPQLAPGFYPLHQLSQLLREQRFVCRDVREGFSLRKQCEELP